MAQIKVYGFDEIIKKLNSVENGSAKIIGAAVFDGAEIIADDLKQAVKDLPIDEHYGTSENPTKGIKKLQKIGLEHGLGIAPMQNDKGFHNVKIGFDGYNLVKTKSHPNGQPNVMIARAVESGTSFSEKIPFVRNTLKKARTPAKKKMVETFEQSMDKILK